MAYRDKSQGFAFVFSDIRKILDGRGIEELESTEGSSRETFNFNKTTPVEKIAPTVPAKPETTERVQAIQEIKSNLDRLQSLHHKLHSMLNEINQMADKRKKR